MAYTLRITASVAAHITVHTAAAARGIEAQRARTVVNDCCCAGGSKEIK